MRFNLKIFYLFAVLFFKINSLFAQTKIGEWRDHLAYVQATGIASSDNKVFVSSNSGVFVYNRLDNSIERLSKVNALTDINISAMFYDQTTETFLVGYQNGNIDLVFGNNTLNMSDILRANILGSKSVNNFTAYNGLIYLSCGFGIVLLDPNREEIRDTYLIGNNGSNVNVNNVKFLNNFIYAFTDAGILRAPATGVNLANFQNWTALNNLPVPNAAAKFTGVLNGAIFTVFTTNSQDYLYKFENETWLQITIPNQNNAKIRHFTIENNKLLVSLNQRVILLNADGSTFKETQALADGWFVNPAAASFTEDGNIWVADITNGLIAFYENNFEVISPNGPFFSNAYRLSIAGDYVYVASGGTNDAWNSEQLTLGYYYLKPDGKWYSVNQFNVPWFDLAKDILHIEPHPRNPENHFVCSYFSGLFEFNGTEFIERYTQENSSLQLNPGWNIWTGVPYAKFDKNENLWVTNCRVGEPISVRKPDGTWKSFTTGGQVAGDLIVTDIMETQSGHLWILSPKQSNATRGILVFDHNQTIDLTQDDRYILLNGTEGKGGLQSDVFCFAEDINGVIWVGTEQGIEVFYNPAAVFSNDVNAQRILIEQDGNVQILLVTETINAIAVDGGNRKWVATQRSGVFLFSEDGQQQIRNFTSENSPLPSNNVFDVEVNNRTGEVFFATEAGVVSYKGDATLTDENNIGNIEVYPNPVTPGYDGVIAMRGFAINSDIKITDISGNIVFQTRSQGGQAIWNGTNLQGQRVATGVYLVFGTDREGENTASAKILFVN